MATRKNTAPKPVTRAPLPAKPAFGPAPGEVERTTLAICRLARATYNPRRITSEKRAALRTSLDTFGMVQEIVVNVRDDGELRVVGGHQRLDILEEDHGADHLVPVCFVRLSDAREKALNLTLNNPNVAGEYTRDVDRVVADLEASDDFSAAMRDSLMIPSLLDMVARDDASATIRNLQARTEPEDDPDDSAELPPGPSADRNGVEKTESGPEKGAPQAEPKGAAGSGTGETRGLGKPVVSYQIVFDDEAQQERFYAFLRALRDKYGDACPTISARLDRFVQDAESIWRQF